MGGLRRVGALGFLVVAIAVPVGAWADHGTCLRASPHRQVGVPIGAYQPRNADEAEIVRLIRTVARGWETKDIDLVMSAYGPAAVQRAWDNPDRMIDRDGIRAEALGAFRDPRGGSFRFNDWIHRIYIVNSSALVEIHENFRGWGTDFYYRDFWVFGKRDGHWELLRYDYQPTTPWTP